MTQKKLYIFLLVSTISSIGFITLLFILTQKELQRDYSFKREFLYKFPKKINELNLEYKAFYIAGTDNDKIYLGNPKSPSFITVLDTALKKRSTIRLSIDKDSILLRSPQLRITPPFFFLIDGTVPYIFRGSTKDWKGYSILETPLYFNNVQVIDSITLAIKALSSKTNEYALGTIHLSAPPTMTLSHKLLQKQVDGVFCVDGTLQFNKQLQQLIYTYRYRNQYIVATKNLKLHQLGKTIDTISQAQLKVGIIKNEQKLVAPALMVNKYSATFGNYLFVNSKRLGRKESIPLWEKSSVIDVYDISKNQYEFSFYVEDIGKSKLKTFCVLHNKFFGLIGNHIVIYKLDNRFKTLK